MKRLSIIALALFVLSAQAGKGWVTLFNGKDLNNFNQVGNANWHLADVRTCLISNTVSPWWNFRRVFALFVSSCFRGYISATARRRSRDSC